ncbi:hypothetical protein H012_gp436 [Acanthamoeba polyphaga moumouvirus]|uniref:Transmembrane protein n=2 Tax=Moumouvirus TaxID=3080801 RepID=L7RD72_9VIRU|nr:hypothetical protein H012_gp436 [Acanthamoeba polyphaga moumouvirus]AEX62695.1 hypothetical protein mv_R490 [Moumouvirus Monve]AGC02023.1 hypothetical protein Moumou_00489 [Acanthamoeba polyphaga moumouvirus]AQN68391.1 hypothetical protein [Saudi moumouvirus]
MTNNYHTQVGKQNMLTQIAANNNLLQQMNNYQGTPINKNNTDQNQYTHQQQPINNYMQQTNNQFPQQNINQFTGPQTNNQYLHQYSQNQPLQNQPLQNQSTTINKTSYNDNGEIELSDTKSPVNEIPNELQNKQQINPVKQEQIIPHSNTQSNSFINPQQQNQINNNIKNLLKDNTNIKTKPIKKDRAINNFIPPNQINPITHHMGQPKIQYVNVPAKKNNFVEYIVIPIILIIIFVFIVHPKTSKIVNKYLPTPKSFLGLVSRGVVLALGYIIIRLLFNIMGL